MQQILNATTKSLEAIMSGAPATTNPAFTASWADNDGTTFTEGSTDGALNGGTAVTLVAAPAASTRRIIKSVTITNIDTASVVVTVRYNNNTTLRTVSVVTLAVGDTWTFEGAYDTSGNFKTTTSSSTPTAITVANEATDASCFPLFVTAATGDLGPKSNANLTFNSNTGVLTLVAPILGTPTSGVMTNVTGVPAASILAGSLGAGAYVISTSLQTATIELGNATDTTLSRVSAGLIAVEGVTLVNVSATQTLTNKTLTAPTINAGTLSGIFTLSESTSIDLDPAQTDQTWTGITRTGTAGATLAFGELCYLAASDSRWELTDADGVTTADRLLGMCVLAAAADGDPTRMLLMGNIQAASKFPTMTIGSAMYIGDDTAGTIETTIPTDADAVIRRVGYALTADELYFNPSMDSQTVVA